MAKKQAVSFKLNGTQVDVLVEPRELLIHTLREKLQHTGPHIGCETSHCGACTVDIDGMSVKCADVIKICYDYKEFESTLPPRMNTNHTSEFRTVRGG